MSIDNLLSLNTFLILVLILNIFIFFDLVIPPKIKLIYPPNKIVSNSDNITFRGYVDKRSELFINELPIYPNNKGYFQQNFYLKEGINKFIIRAKKYWQQEKIIEREIFYKKQ